MHRSNSDNTGASSSVHKRSEKLHIMDMDLAYEPKPTPSPLSLMQENVMRTNSSNQAAGFGMNRKVNDLLSSVTTSNNDDN
jgi:hypothetical protein